MKDMKEKHRSGVFGKRYYNKYLSGNNWLRTLARDRLQLSPRVRALFKAIESLPTGARVLDVGCGTGGLLELMERSNQVIHTFGVDIGTPPEFRARASLTRGSGSLLPFPDETFDVITCAHVIEHIPAPGAVVLEFFRVLKPGGIVYLETPSQRSALMPLGFSFWDDPTHIRPYTCTALKWLLSDSGFGVIAGGTKKSMPAVLFGLPYMFIGKIVGDAQSQYIFSTYAFGLFVYALGRKPE